MRLPTSLRRSKDTPAATAANANSATTTAATEVKSDHRRSDSLRGLDKWESLLGQVAPSVQANNNNNNNSCDDNGRRAGKKRQAGSPREFGDAATPTLRRQRNRAQIEAVDSYYRYTSGAMFA